MTTVAAAPKNSGQFGKGNRGKPKGAVNHVTADVKAMILQALEHAGGGEYLFTQAFDNPKAFLALVGKVLPLQVVGDPTSPIQFVITEREADL